jgi:glycosyltransferase involved in cell wall biosynthesis
MRPTITVLMPLYDAKDFLAEAIESVLNQTFSDFEFLIVDDSSDGSYEIAKAYAEKDSRIRIIKNDPPLGLRKSSNLGIKEAKGEYIARMEADDISLSNRLELQLKFMYDHPEVDVSGCFLQLFGNQDGQWTYPLSDKEIKAGLIWGITIAHPTTFMKRSFLVEGNHYYNPDGLPYAEDREFFYDMHRSATFKNLPEFLYKYRRSSDSVTKRMKERRLEIRKMLLCKIFTDFGLKFSDEDILIHQFILGDFFLDVNKGNLIKARRWHEQLLKHNNYTNYYDNEVFNKVAEAKWNRLFYFILNKDKSLAFNYFIETKYLSFKKLFYWFKLQFNDFLRKRK